MLNELFLGANSQVNLETFKTIDQLKLSFSRKLDSRKLDYFSQILDIDNQCNTKFVYSISNSKLKISFSKETKTSFRITNLSIYPSFVGTLENYNSKSIIKGKIGIPEHYWWFYIIWFIPFFYMFSGWLFYEDSFPEGHIAIYFIMFGLLTLIVILMTMRNRVDALREELINIIESEFKD